MYIVYVLKDDKDRLYKGLTDNLQRRLKEHRSGHTITTSRMQSIDVIFTEVYPDFETARKREKYFKSAAGRKYLKKIIIRKDG